MKLWQTHTKLLCLISGMWPWCPRPYFACWALIFFIVHPFFLKKGTQGCAGMPEQSMCAGGLKGTSLPCQHVGISAWKPVLLGMGTILTEAGADGTRSLNQPVSFMLY